jgi:hypothetical protein
MCEEFCEAFEAKLDTKKCCCSIRNNSVTVTIPDCLGHHLRQVSDPVVAALYGVYWGAKSGVLSDEQVSQAHSRLSTVARLDNNGLRLMPNANQTQCILPKHGLEIFAGCFCDNPVFLINNNLVAARAALDNPEAAWISNPGMNRISLCFEHPSAVGMPYKPNSYSYLQVEGGSFVSSTGEMLPVQFRLCKSGTDTWMEYHARTGRWMRYPGRGFADCSMGGTCAPLTMLILDARNEVFVRENGVHTNMLHNSGTSRFVGRAMKWAETRARDLAPMEPVMVCMPQPTESPSSEASAALVEACWRETVSQTAWARRS